MAKLDLEEYDKTKIECPKFDICKNVGKNNYCDQQTLDEIDCFIPYDLNKL